MRGGEESVKFRLCMHSYSRNFANFSDLLEKSTLPQEIHGSQAEFGPTPRGSLHSPPATSTYLHWEPSRWLMNSRQKPTSYTVSPLGYQCFLSINTLSVGSIDGVVWPKKLFQKKPPNLYVEVQVEGSVQHTRVVERSTTPAWNEEFSV